MNRIDRLFAITTHLQANGRLRASDLAQYFEVSTRTIYRDIAALSESGIPVVSLPGQGYALADGYFLPPLHLSLDEATSLLLGARMVASQAGAGASFAATSAATKILAALDDAPRRRLQELDSALEVASAANRSGPLDLEDERVASLLHAILERRVASLRYFGKNRSAETSRQVEPMRLSYVDGAWYLTAYCRMRHGLRAFRLDRIEELRIEATRFQPRAIAPAAPRTDIAVVVHFRDDVARWVRERQHWSFTREIESGGGLTAEYRPEHLAEIVPWLQGWGAAATVLSPPELREILRREALALVEMLT